MIEGLNVRIIDGPVDMDVTEHVAEITDLSHSAAGGFGESAQFTLDLPRWTFPTLGEQSRVIVTDDAGTVVWEGFASDPGPVSGQDGEVFDMLASGSMVLGSDRVEPVVYLDGDLGSWVAVEGAAESAQLETIEDGFRLAHPQGQPIGTGAYAGAEWRLLEHATQDIGQVRFTTKCGVGSSAGYFAMVHSVNAAGVASLVDGWAASTAETARTVTLPAGTRVVQVRWVRTGGATNVTDELAWVEIGSPVVIGARVDVFGAPVAPTSTVTASDVVADLIGRGLLTQVDPVAAQIEATGFTHKQLAFAGGARGSAVIAELRKSDPDIIWGYGPRARDGYAFWWRQWPTGSPRYSLTDADEVTLTGGDDERCHRISVYYTDPDAKRQKHVTVTMDLPRSTRTRDADPITLEEATEEEAVAAGRDALARLSSKPPSGTATVARLIYDRARGVDVEPWEIVPGALAMIEATGEVLRITSTSLDVDDSGAECTLSLGDPEQTIDDRLLAIVRGEVDPRKPLIDAPSGPTVPTPAPTGAPTHALKEEFDATVSAIEGDFIDVYAEIASGDSANAQAINAAVSDFTAGLATKSKHTLSPNPPGSAANNAGDVWERHKAGDATAIIARYRGQGGTSWLPMNLDATYIPQLDIGTGTFGDLTGERLVANTVGISKLLITDLTDHVTDPYMKMPLATSAAGADGWYVASGDASKWRQVTAGSATPSGTTSALRVDHRTGGTTYVATPSFAVETGEQYHVDAMVKRADGTATGNFLVGLVFAGPDGSQVGSSYISTPVNTVPFTWTRIAYSNEGGVVPAGAVSARVVLHTNVMGNGVQLDFTEVHCRRRSAGELIVDGSIQARHLTADSITGLLVTGAAIQTHDDGTPPWSTGRGIKISGSGLMGYPASGAASPTFAFNTSTGRAHLTGGVSTGTGYDDITITPGTPGTPSAVEFWSNHPLYDNAGGERSGIYCTGDSWLPEAVVSTFRGPKITSSGVRPRIELRTYGDTSATADVMYHAGEDSGATRGNHVFILNGTTVASIDRFGLTLNQSNNTTAGRIGIGVNISSIPQNTIHTIGTVRANGLIDLSVASGANTGWQTSSATWNSAGRLVGSVSSQRLKQDIEPLSLEVARRALDLEPVTFRYKPEVEMGDDRFPGFIAEQADGAGLDLWVTRDADGDAAGFRYAELVAAHTAILRDLDDRLAALEGATDA